MAHALASLLNRTADQDDPAERPKRPLRGARTAKPVKTNTTVAPESAGFRVVLNNGVELHLPPILEGKAALAFAKRQGILTAKGNFTKRFK